VSVGARKLFTLLPRRLILGNSYSYARIPIRYRGVCKRPEVDQLRLEIRQLLSITEEGGRTARAAVGFVSMAAPANRLTTHRGGHY